MLHPATVLGLWMAFVLALPRLSGASLALAGGGLLLAALAQPAARGHFLKLVRRSRVLLLMLALVYGAATPGRPVIEALPWSPSVAGLAEGLLQAARLALILASLAWVWARLGRAGLMSGLYAALMPLARLGVPVQAFVVRLALVLEQEPPVARLRGAGLAGLWEAPPAGGADRVVIELAPFTWRDGVALAAATLVLAGLLA